MTIRLPVKLHLAVIVALSVVLNACSDKRSSDESEWTLPEYPQKVMPTAAAESQCNSLYTKNPRGKRLSWKTSVPVTFYFDASFPEEYVPSVRAAMATWNQAAGFTILRDSGYRTTSSLPGYDSINTIYFASPQTTALANAVRGLFGRDGTVAVTNELSMANKYVDTDIVFNGVEKAFSNSRFRYGTYDVETIALHELGHALGLDHNPSPLSTMYFSTIPFGLAVRTLDETSQKLLNCEY